MQGDELIVTSTLRSILNRVADVEVLKVRMIVSNQGNDYACSVVLGVNGHVTHTVEGDVAHRAKDAECNALFKAISLIRVDKSIQVKDFNYHKLCDIEARSSFMRRELSFLTRASIDVKHIIHAADAELVNIERKFGGCSEVKVFIESIRVNVVKFIGSTSKSIARLQEISDKCHE